MEQDGNGVYGPFETSTGTSRVNDGNGSSGGCGNATFDRVNRFRVREDQTARPDPCSSWGDRPGPLRPKSYWTRTRASMSGNLASSSRTEGCH